MTDQRSHNRTNFYHKHALRTDFILLLWGSQVDSEGAAVTRYEESQNDKLIKTQEFLFKTARKAHIKAGDNARLIQLHAHWPMHGVFFKKIQDSLSVTDSRTAYR